MKCSAEGHGGRMGKEAAFHGCFDCSFSCQGTKPVTKLKVYLENVKKEKNRAQKVRFEEDIMDIFRVDRYTAVHFWDCCTRNSVPLPIII